MNINLHKRICNSPIYRRTRIRGNSSIVIKIAGDSVTKTRATVLVKGIERAIRDSGLGPALRYNKLLKD